MKARTNVFIAASLVLIALLAAIPASARQGQMDAGAITGKVLLSNGPEGPIKGGESSIVNMLLMPDGAVVGATQAIYGAESCHLFKVEGENTAHLVNVTAKLPGQAKVCNIVQAANGTVVGGTSTYNEIFDDSKNTYEGGHLFAFDPATRAFTDYGVVMAGQGINCVAVDTLHTRIYCVTYPKAHLFSFDYATKQKKDHGMVMQEWRVKDLGLVSWRGVPKVLMIDDAGTVYFSTYYNEGAKADDQGDPFNSGLIGGRILRMAYGDDKPVFTGAVVPTQKGMDNDPIYENTIVAAIKAKDGGFWCGSSVDGFLFKFYPSTSTVVNYGKAFNYWNLKSFAYGGDGSLYMLGGRDYDYSWLLKFDAVTRSFDCVGYPGQDSQVGAISADKDGNILMGENSRNSYIYFYGNSK